MRFVLTFLTCITLIGAAIAAPAAAHEVNKVVFVEYFSMPLCSYDQNYHGVLENLRRHDGDVLMLNCPMPFQTEDPLFVDDDPGIGFCEWRARMYNHNNKELYHNKSDLIMINGIYDTESGYPEVLTSGVAAAKEHDITPVMAMMIHRGGQLHVALPPMKRPDMGEEAEPMELFFFAFNRQRDFIRAVENDFTQISTSTEMPSIENGMLKKVPTSITNTVSHGRLLGEWNGTPETISINLDDIKADNYAVIAQDKHFGAVRMIATTEH